MPDDNGEKESFFDFSEARSWPPSDGFETEEENDQKEFDQNEESDLNQELNIPSEAEKNVEVLENYEEENLLSLFSSDLKDEEELDLSHKEELNLEDKEELNLDFSSISLSKPEEFVEEQSVKPLEEEPEEIMEETLIDSEPNDFTLPEEYEEALETRLSNEIIEEDISNLFQGTDTKDNDFNFEDKSPKTKPIESTLDDLLLEENESIASGPAFKAYASYDYSSEILPEDLETKEGEEKKSEIQLSRPALIFIILFLLVGAYWIYSNFFIKKYESKRPKREAKVSSKRSSINIQKELMPLWDISSQSLKSWKDDVNYIKEIKAFSGRENPFLLPESILEDLRRAAEEDLIKKTAPEVNSYNAYRATLIGVVGSEGRILALIDLRTADFEVVEGTSKPKIIKLAIKSMTKAKENTLELFQGENIGGDWIIDSIDSGEDTMSEARVMIRRGKDYKVLRMGQAVDLGVFDENDRLVVFSE